MSRADRLLSLLDYLRGREATTVAEVAAAMRVSSRAVYRDLATLRGRGVPITSDTGPGGGIRLEGDRGVTAVHLSTDEVVALWLSAQLSAAATALPWGNATRSGLQKLFASVPKERARAMRALCQRVVVSRPASAHVMAQLTPPPAELLSLFERAFAEQICLSFDYRDRDGRASRRCIEPHGLLVEPPAWYVLARDAEREVARVFRIDRIRRPRLMPTMRFTANLALFQEQWRGDRTSIMRVELPRES